MMRMMMMNGNAGNAGNAGSLVSNASFLDDVFSSLLNTCAGALDDNTMPASMLSQASQASQGQGQRQQHTGGINKATTTSTLAAGSLAGSNLSHASTSDDAKKKKKPINHPKPVPVHPTTGPVTLVDTVVNPTASHGPGLGSHKVVATTGTGTASASSGSTSHKKARFLAYLQKRWHENNQRYGGVNNWTCVLMEVTCAPNGRSTTVHDIYETFATSTTPDQSLHITEMQMHRLWLLDVTAWKPLMHGNTNPSTGQRSSMFFNYYYGHDNKRRPILGNHNDGKKAGDESGRSTGSSGDQTLRTRADVLVNVRVKQVSDPLSYYERLVRRTTKNNK